MVPLIEKEGKAGGRAEEGIRFGVGGGGVRGGGVA